MGKKETIVVWEQRGDSMTRVGTVAATLADAFHELVKEIDHVSRGNGKPVRAVGVDEAQARKWQEPRGRAKPVEEEQIFQSALAASLHLGFTSNEVGTRLAKARRVEEAATRGEFGAQNTVRLRPTVLIRGVTFQYEKDVPL